MRQSLYALLITAVKNVSTAQTCFSDSHFNIPLNGPVVIHNLKIIAGAYWMIPPPTDSREGKMTKEAP